ncbi:glycosyltransferase family 2 protein [Apilactobacillus timberlakei]|uniref:Glycosyltransferase family 2 protein n=1 Tax=Apilactobacillus timberlakei TaxID=2008380 RepID=A0ABY2YV54_9LACO|nr:glycosyltransferase family 2 protein [Apilactobacillus timberlakei]TPR15786.1 glycosyltransferase family 2 protein [Apilactobacillus timberlakei]TPR16147.1 glycosyltransferase family 2 protein [Apilactobacillus timberlakei]
MDKVSIIVPIYNAHEYLAPCLQSIKNQTYTNIEVIMVDDGSTDDSSRICKEYVDVDARFKYIHQNNSGVSAARNKGLENVSGKYLIFIDGDDYVDNNHVEMMMNEISPDVQMIVTGYYNKLVNKDVPMIPDDNLLSVRSVYYKILKDIRIQGFLVNKLFNVKILSSSPRNRFDTSIYFGEDLLFVFSYLRKCEMIKVRHIATYHYRYNTLSASKQKPNAEMFSNITTLLSAYIKVFENESLLDDRSKSFLKRQIVKLSLIYYQEAAILNIDNDRFLKIYHKYNSDIAWSFREKIELVLLKNKYGFKLFKVIKKLF